MYNTLLRILRKDLQQGKVVVLFASGPNCLIFRSVRVSDLSVVKKGKERYPTVVVRIHYYRTIVPWLTSNLLLFSRQGSVRYVCSVQCTRIQDPMAFHHRPPLGTQQASTRWGVEESDRPAAGRDLEVDFEGRISPSCSLPWLPFPCLH